MLQDLHAVFCCAIHRSVQGWEIVVVYFVRPTVQTAPETCPRVQAVRLQEKGQGYAKEDAMLAEKDGADGPCSGDDAGSSAMGLARLIRCVQFASRVASRPWRGSRATTRPSPSSVREFGVLSFLL